MWQLSQREIPLMYVSIELGNIISIIVCCQKYHLFQSTSTKPQNWRIFYLKSHSKNMTEITENTSSSWHLFSIFVPKLGLVHSWDSYLTIFHSSVRLSWTCFLHFCNRNNQEIKSARIKSIIKSANVEGWKQGIVEALHGILVGRDHWYK